MTFDLDVMIPSWTGQYAYVPDGKYLYVTMGESENIRGVLSVVGRLEERRLLVWGCRGSCHACSLS